MSDDLGSSFTIDTINDVVVLKKKIIGGLFFSGVKKIITQIIQTSSGIILARLLFPQIFGAFAITLIYVSFFGLFAVAGLGMALTQRKRDPSKEELQSAFTFNLLLSLFITVSAILVAPFFYRFYQPQLGEQGLLYLRLLTLSLLAVGLKSIPMVKLQRELNYRRIVIGEAIEVFLTQLLAVILALKGFGLLGLILGNVIGPFLGGAIFFLLAPWPIGLNFSFEKIKTLLPFGINYQINNVVSMVNSAVVPVFVGKATGSAAVGLLSWAAGLTAFPRAVSELLGQVIFTACCRAQDDKRLLGVLVEKSIQLACFGSFPLVIILAALAYPTAHIVYTDKWLAGVPALGIFSIQSVFVVVSSVFMQVLLALGEVKKVRNISIFWTVLQWILTVPLVIKLGFIGMPVAATIVSATFFLPLNLLHQKVAFKTAPYIWPYLVYSLIAGMLTYFINHFYPPQNFFALVAVAGAGGVIYLLLVLIFQKDEIERDILRVKRYLLGENFSIDK